MAITGVILGLRAAYLKSMTPVDPDFPLSPRHINQGRCELFAMDVLLKVPGARVRSTGALTREELPEHYWVLYNGRHYDAEAPEGVENWRDLPFFRRIDSGNFGEGDHGTG